MSGTPSATHSRQRPKVGAGVSRLSAGLMKNLTLYRVLMGASVVLIGYGGVITHLPNIGHLDLCQSVWTWAGAIGVTVSG